MARAKESRSAIVQVKVTPADKARIEREAAAQHRSMSNWVYGLIMHAFETLDAERRDPPDTTSRRATEPPTRRR